MASAPRRFGLIPAAGDSARFGGPLPKQYAQLAGVPVIRQAIRALNESIALDAVFVVLAVTSSMRKGRYLGGCRTTAAADRRARNRS